MKLFGLFELPTKLLLALLHFDPYHPQSNSQVENANQEINAILEKMVAKHRCDWVEQLNEALWTFQTAYKTPIGTTPFQLVYGNMCHLPVQVEHKTFWALKTLSNEFAFCREREIMAKLDKWRHLDYDNAQIYNEKNRAYHNKRIKDNQEFKGEYEVLLFNSVLKLFHGKLKSRCSGPFKVVNIFLTTLWKSPT